MDLDTRICERARLSRDPRFDGRIFIGVKTTGVYCRPICPVRPPMARNVTFYPSAAAAAEAGYRPCLRCRPEASPGTPAWLGTSATVSRALRLIAAGALNDGSVQTLAERLGVGARHLDRLFHRHIGASPVAVAQTRRLHFAKRLIDETDLPMWEVASSSGFGSVRRFNDAFARTYARTPSELRRGRRRGLRASPSLEDDRFLLRLSFRPPFDWHAALGFLAGRATPGVECVGANTYCRTISLGGHAGRFEVRPVDGENFLSLHIDFPDSAALFRIVERVRLIFDLGADPQEISKQLARDRRFAAAIRAHPGLRVPGAWDPFELAVRAILGQQISVKGATTLAGRIAVSFGEKLIGEVSDGSRERAPDVIFPTPAVLAEADLSRIGLTRARAHAIRELARAVETGELVMDTAIELPELEEMLTRLPGIGSWTAQYIAMRALGEPDAFPATDLALLRAAGNGKAITPRALLEQAEAWRPWRAYAAMYLWQSYTKQTRQTRSRPGRNHQR